MTQVPASSHGVTFPSEWATGGFGGLTITSDDPTGADVPLKLQGVAGSGGNLIRIINDLRPVTAGGESEAFAVTGDGSVLFRSGSGSIGFNIVDEAGTSYLNFRSAIGLSYTRVSAVVFNVSNTGLVTTKGIAANPLTSGALPTVAPVSGTAFQCSTTRDVFLTVPVTYNPGVATTATCKVELSPDNVTFSELVTITQPVGTVFDGSIEAVSLIVPAAWRVKLTVTNATLGTGTYY